VKEQQVAVGSTELSQATMGHSAGQQTRLPIVRRHRFVNHAKRSCIWDEFMLADIEKREGYEPLTATSVLPSRGLTPARTVVGCKRCETAALFLVAAAARPRVSTFPQPKISSFGT
jgi:hypothetical protein